MQQKNLFLISFFLLNLFSNSFIFASKKDIRPLLHKPDTIEHLLQGESIISWLKNDAKDPIKGYIIIHLLEGIMLSLLFPDYDLIEAMQKDADLKKEIHEEIELLPMVIQTLHTLLETNEHTSPFKEKITDIFFAIDCRITPSLIDTELKKIMNEFHLSLNTKIKHETCVHIIKDIENWAILFNEEIRKNPPKEKEEDIAYSPEDIIIEKIEQKQPVSHVYDEEFGIWVEPDFYNFWLNPEDKPI